MSLVCEMTEMSKQELENAIRKVAKDSQLQTKHISAAKELISLLSYATSSYRRVEEYLQKLPPNIREEVIGNLSSKELIASEGPKYYLTQKGEREDILQIMFDSLLSSYKRMI